MRTGFLCGALASLLLGFNHPVSGQASISLDPWHAAAASTSSAGSVAAQGIEHVLINPAAIAKSSAFAATRGDGGDGVTDVEVGASYRTPFGGIAVLVRRRDWGAVAEELGVADLGVSEGSATLAYATTLLSDALSIGVSITGLQGNYLGSSVGASTVDVGARLVLGDNIRFGTAILRSWGSYEEVAGRQATTLRVGGSYVFHAARLDITPLMDVAVLLAGARKDVFSGATVSYGREDIRLEGSVGASLLDVGSVENRQASWSFGAGASYSKVGVRFAKHVRQLDVPGSRSLSLSVRM